MLQTFQTFQFLPLQAPICTFTSTQLVDKPNARESGQSESQASAIPSASNPVGVNWARFTRQVLADEVDRTVKKKDAGSCNRETRYTVDSWPDIDLLHCEAKERSHYRSVKRVWAACSVGVHFLGGEAARADETFQRIFAPVNMEKR